MKFRNVRGGAIAAAFAAVLLSTTAPVCAQSAAATNAELATKGIWDAGTTYAKDDIVVARGSAWISLKANNKNRVPGQTQPSSATFWQLFARGFNPAGAWSNATKYQPDDLVTFNGQTWRAKITQTNRQPTANQFWELFAAKGAAGPNTGIDLGTQSAPSISFNGDAGTGIYSPAAGKIAMVASGSLFLHNLGTGNTSLGLGALPSTSTGSQNTALGSSALSANTTGAGNVALGYSALSNSVDGGANIAIGSGALFLNTHGTGNVAVGASALGSYGGNSNVAIGRSALLSNTTGANNVAVGHLALSNSTTADNTAVGYQAMTAQTTGFNNTAVGSGALAANTSGAQNVAIGNTALAVNTASINTAVGSGALAANTTGSNNVAVGKALTANTVGSYNVGIGVGAMQNMDDGDNNVAIGGFALPVSTGGSANIAIGLFALAASTSGDNNIALGQGALSGNTNGSSNISIGYNSAVNPTAPQNSIFIGNPGAANDTATIKIGTQGTQTDTYIAGVFGGIVDNNTDVPVGIDATGKLGTVASSRRYKHDIETMPDMSALLTQLRPVTFHYNWAQKDGTHPLQYGLIAEEVADTFPALAALKDGRPETVRYQLLPPLLLSGWQAQQKTIAAQADKIDALEERLRRLEAALPRIKEASVR